MRTIVTVAALVVFAGALVAADDKKFESKDGKYSAKFPGEPKTDSKKAEGVEVNTAIFQRSDKVGFAVIYSDIAAGVVKDTPGPKLLEGGEKGLVDNFKAKVTKSGETKFTSNGKDYPARDILAEKDDQNLRITLILVGTRLYQVFVVGPKDVVVGKEADDFIKSFELAK